MTTLIPTAAEMINLGRSIGEGLKPGDVVAFEAPLGAGKTTLTKGIAQALEVEEEITSPTFTIISEYPGKIPLFHMDFYRITQEEDLETLGVEEFFYRRESPWWNGAVLPRPSCPNPPCASA